MKLGNWFILHRDAIGPEHDPYMVRYKLIETPWFSVRVHQIRKSDQDRDTHDHPWSFLSIVLRGGYCEWTPLLIGSNAMLFGNEITAPRIIFRRAEDLHRLELRRPAWTLVLTGPRRREWGFQTEDGWMPWQEYLAEDGDKPAESHERNGVAGVGDVTGNYVSGGTN